MHKASKLLAILFAAVLFFNSIGVAEASTSKPTKVWDWTKGAYSFEGTASMENLYTNYRFTNMFCYVLTKLINTLTASANYDTRFCCYNGDCCILCFSSNQNS